MAAGGSGSDGTTRAIKKRGDDVEEEEEEEEEVVEGEDRRARLAVPVCMVWGWVQTGKAVSKEKGGLPNFVRPIYLYRSLASSRSSRIRLHART